jgi:hypothetical protein
MIPCRLCGEITRRYWVVKTRGQFTLGLLEYNLSIISTGPGRGITAFCVPIDVPACSEGPGRRVDRTEGGFWCVHPVSSEQGRCPRRRRGVNSDSAGVQHMNRTNSPLSRSARLTHKRPLNKDSSRVQRNTLILVPRKAAARFQMHSVKDRPALS